MSSLMKTVDHRDYIVDTGEGALLQTDKGPRLDFFGDSGTASLGYNHLVHENALARVRKDRIPIHAPNITPFPERERAARRLCEATEMDKVFFCNSGTESVEAAIKLARLHQWKQGAARSGIWSMRGGFHGRTYASLTASDGPSYYTNGFGPLPGEFHRFENVYDIDRAAAAVILSPIGCHHTVEMYSDEWMNDLRAYTKRHGILLIFDEVQTGAGRTGHWSYGAWEGYDPDIICLAKGMAAGFPMGAMLAKGAVAEAFEPGHHFSTFGGSPLACVFLNEMLDWLDDQALRRIDKLGQTISIFMDGVKGVSNIRGTGLMWAFDTERDAREVAKECDEDGLIIGVWRENPVKISPPLSVTDVELFSGLCTLRDVLERGL